MSGTERAEGTKMMTKATRDRMQKLGDELANILMTLESDFASIEAVHSDRHPAIWIRAGKISGETVTYVVKRCKYDDGADWRDGV